MREKVLRKGRWGSWDEARVEVTLQRGDLFPRVRDKVHPDRTSGSRVGRHSGRSVEASLSGVASPGPHGSKCPCHSPCPRTFVGCVSSKCVGLVKSSFHPLLPGDSVSLAMQTPPEWEVVPAVCPRGSHKHAITLLPGRIGLLVTKEKKPSWPPESQPSLKTRV